MVRGRAELNECSTREKKLQHTSLQMLFQRGLFEQVHLAVNGIDGDPHSAFLLGLGREDGK